MQPARQNSPRFVVVEGMDGSGKGTHLPFIEACLSAGAGKGAAEATGAAGTRGPSVLVTREPGGSPLAETLRDLVLNRPMDGLTECLTVFAARRDHLTQTIWPALAAGQTVLCDRYLDSSWAYQGAGRGLDPAVLALLSEQVERGGPGPDLVIYFDLPAAVAAARRAQRDAGLAQRDRFEQEDLAFFERVRQGYREAAARRSPQTVAWIDASQTPQDIQKQLSDILVKP